MAEEGKASSVANGQSGSNCIAKLFFKTVPFQRSETAKGLRRVVRRVLAGAAGLVGGSVGGCIEDVQRTAERDTWRAQ